MTLLCPLEQGNTNTVALVPITRNIMQKCKNLMKTRRLTLRGELFSYVNTYSNNEANAKRSAFVTEPRSEIKSGGDGQAPKARAIKGPRGETAPEEC